MFLIYDDAINDIFVTTISFFHLIYLNMTSIYFSIFIFINIRDFEDLIYKLVTNSNYK